MVESRSDRCYDRGMAKQSVAPNPDAPGFITVREGNDTILSVWSWDISSVSVNPKGADTQIGLRGSNGTWFSCFVPPGEVMTSVSGAMALYIREERMLKAVRAA